MAFNITNLTANVNNIQALTDTPNTADGLTAQELKQRFDKAGADIKTYVNGTLIPELEAKVDNIDSNITNINSTVQTIMGLLHPIGSIYISVNEVNPQTIFGGTWEQIKDTFLLSAGDTYEAGSTGGEATHTLTINEMPSHKHSQKFNQLWDLKGGTECLATTRGAFYNSSYIQETGGSQPHNNMPPYLAVYVWKRIA